MENSASTKQFQVILFENEIFITTPSNRNKALQAKINVPRRIRIGDHDYIETDYTALNYYECCGCLILFGINPPSFEELYQLFVPN